jgi:hypothetical protein
MSDLFRIASSWESDTITEEDRSTMKNFIEKLVGYPCRLACKENDGAIDIYVFSVKENKVTDWIELQASGAVGIIYDFYDDTDSELDDACEEYNEEHDVVFAEEEEEDKSDN